MQPLPVTQRTPGKAEGIEIEQWSPGINQRVQDKCKSGKLNPKADLDSQWLASFVPDQSGFYIILLTVTDTSIYMFSDTTFVQIEMLGPEPGELLPGPPEPLGVPVIDPTGTTTATESEPGIE